MVPHRGVHEAEWDGHDIAGGFSRRHLSGLCDQYEPPTYPNEHGPQKPDETAAQFERPAFYTWTSFKP